jgi:hypothetical protein
VQQYSPARSRTGRRAAGPRGVQPYNPARSRTARRAAVQPGVQQASRPRRGARGTDAVRRVTAASGG